MKKILFSILSSVLLLFTGCVDLNMNPLSEGSSDNWFTTEDEFLMATNELYRHEYWYWETTRFNNTDRFSDDWNQRDYMYDWLQGSIASDNGQVESCWKSNYAGIARANIILASIEKARAQGLVPEKTLSQCEGEASFFRACFYSYLVFLWGDVPFYTTSYLSIDEASRMTRTDKSIVLEQIYKDFDKASETLPDAYSTGLQRITKGAAYAFKARSAIWMNDYQTAAQAAGDCIDLDKYSLHPDFAELFLSKTTTSPEIIFSLARSKGLMENQESTKSRLPRNAGGQAAAQPSWELLCSFLCTDGLTIDKSPLYDPANPFKNRDPRCTATIVEHGTEFLDYIFDPGKKTTLKVSTGAMVSNKDSRLVEQYSAFNGMCLKKGVDEEWIDDMETDGNIIVMRYADVLLMYAEAKMELDQIDQSVLKAVNTVRSRAYGASYLQTTKYPAVTTVDQAELRTAIRMERRSELAWENRRWFDLIRWRLCEKALRGGVYCHDQTKALEAVISSGDYFFPKGVLPVIDKDGLVDLTPLYRTGKIIKINDRNFPERQYLFPIPAKDRMLNKNLTQNDGY